jgi:hypothetical protein
MRLLPILLALWALLVPTFCLAGAFTHACDGCGDEPACAHEEECAEDPCSETMVRPMSGGGGQDLVAPPVSPDSRLTIALPTPPAPRSVERPPGARLPVPESDLPLLS